MSDFVDTLGDDWLEQTENVEEVEQKQPEPEPAKEAEAPEEAPEAEAKGEETETEEAAPPKPHMVPYHEMKKEREARQELERRLAALEQNKQQPQPEPAKIPDAYEDPEGFNRWVQEQGRLQQFNTRAEISGIRAEQRYGRETVEAAITWAQGLNDPALSMKVQNAPSPVEVVVEEYRRSLTHQTLGEKTPEEWAREYAVQQGWIVSEPQGQPAPAQPKPSSPPKTLASARSGGRSAPVAADWGEVKFALDR